ncbi:MAG: putative 3-demethylubiquinone-9 3-methyltransferase (glyoxalase superfamily) [Yoonia sp.]|jgi:predicted 3-demethylubiquinone-9 3-methyltransferase (glyoxalase superfamily)
MYVDGYVRSGRKTGGIMTAAKNTICIWYDKDAEVAARFYASIFPESAVTAILKAPADYP